MNELEHLKRVNSDIEAGLVSKETSVRLGDLRSLILDKSQRLEQVTRFVKDARAYVSDFPNEAQVLKYERRVESLKDQIKQAERIANQHRAGIEAYHTRLFSNHNELQSLLDNASQLLDETLSIMNPLVHDEMSIVGTTNVGSACESLQSIMIERESQLQAKCSSLESIQARERELSQAAGVLQLTLEEELPKVDAEKNRDEAEIRQEWSREEHFLNNVLDKLFTVHKEHSFHLQRGTHIKKDTALPATESEIVLSARQSHLAVEVNKGKTAMQDLKEELVQYRRQLETLRQKAKDYHKEFEKERDARELRLASIRKRHLEAVDESQTLRNVKAELNQALQAVREVPHNVLRQNRN